MNRKEGIPELNGRQPDRRAVQIAQEIHQDRAPLATILFGSRARGDHNEDRSDIDILIVEDNPPDELEQYRFQQKQKPRSLGAYGKEVRIHLVWATPAQIREDDIHINSLCTRAMLEGVTISETPEKFRSRYDSPDPPDPQYDWFDYEAYLAGSLNNLKVIQLVMAQKEGDWETAESIRVLPPWSLLKGQKLRWLIARNSAVRSMHGALAAAIAGTGDVPQGHDPAPQRMERLRTLLPHEDLETLISMEDYGGRRGVPRRNDQTGLRADRTAGHSEDQGSGQEGQAADRPENRGHGKEPERAGPMTDSSRCSEGGSTRAQWEDDPADHTMTRLACGHVMNHTS